MRCRIICDVGRRNFFAAAIDSTVSTTVHCGMVISVDEARTPGVPGMPFEFTLDMRDAGIDGAGPSGGQGSFSATKSS